ncbi:choline/carnitine O-acyltransferase [Agarivorans sp. Z349TD_8]|uniref:choline/carnitine O-acyltransferase n=1 Tax=Agarivorans sp. Z349TD_8 TaxID=3421434 RepID=UPI003D7E10EE
MDNTFSCQKELPIMPVPELNETCGKFMEWAAPLLTEQERGQTRALITRFLQPGGEGERLQHDLIEWAQAPAISNWFAPVWRDFYLACPKSLVIHSNVFYYLKSKLDEKTNSQATIAAALIVSVYQFIALIDNKTLKVDMQKDLPLCMEQYQNIFSATRIPQQGTDALKVGSSRKHIVIMHHQRIYQLNVLDEYGNIYAPSALKAAFDEILSGSEKGQNFGLLSTLPRDNWAKSRADLLDISARNGERMRIIEDAAFVVSLDEDCPEALTEISKQLLHGSGQDRFFDKSLQFIVFKNGKTGINFEHSGVDGSVMLRLIAHIYDTIDQCCLPQAKVSAKRNQAAVPLVEEIEFDLNDDLKQTLCSAEDWFALHVANTQTRVLNFTQFGKNQIKQFGVSPDAFVQLALQLAEYKLYGKCFSAYEAVMTRTFLGGRIDVLYTVSPESMLFIESIGAANCSTEAKKSALIQATRKHVARAKECRFGQGVHAHLLALKYRYTSVGDALGIENLPQIFSDVGYQALTHSIVCTSTTSEYGVELAGYGPIVDDGFGIRYFKQHDSICFNMTSRTAMQDKLEQMQAYIEQSLLEMAELMRS